MEEQIITDLYNYRDEKTGHRIVSMALHNKDAVLLGLGGPMGSDIIFFVARRVIVMTMVMDYLLLAVTITQRCLQFS